MGRYADIDGDVVFVAVASPAPGADWTWTVPANLLVEIISAHMTFNAVAGGGTRYPRLLVTGNGRWPLNSPAGRTIAASTSAHIGYHQGMTPFALAGDDAIVGGLPVGNRFSAGFTIATNTPGITAGDQYANIGLVVRQWLLPY
jgi:hypothetical protein